MNFNLNVLIKKVIDKRLHWKSSDFTEKPESIERQLKDKHGHVIISAVCCKQISLMWTNVLVEKKHYRLVVRLSMLRTVPTNTEVFLRGL